MAAEGAGTGGHALELLPATHSICRLDARVGTPDWAQLSAGALLSVTRSEDELSIVCAEGLAPAEVETSDGWRALRVRGTLDHALTGVLVSLAAPLAEAGVPIFAVSSFDTDYLLVPAVSLHSARTALEAAGHSV